MHIGLGTQELLLIMKLKLTRWIKIKIESQYQLLKSKSQDAAFKQLRSTLNTKDNGIANRLIRSIQDLVMNNAEDLGEFYPDMSEAYYYKRLEEACDSNIKEMKRMQP